MVRKPWQQALEALVLFGFLACVTVATFSPWAPDVFFGDDISSYIAFLDGRFASSLLQVLIEGASEKYRPVYQTAQSVFLHLFGAHYQSYIWLGYLMHALNGVLVYRICQTITGGRLFLPLVAAAVFCSLRFGYFNITLVGLVEALSLLFLLAAVQVSLTLFLLPPDAGRARASRLSLALIGLLFLAIFTHERYLAATPWAMALLVAAPGLGTEGRGYRIWWALAAVAPAVVNLLYKRFVLGSRIAVGTGGEGFVFDPSVIWPHLYQAILSLVGFNSGPAYLSGYEVRSLTEPAALAATVFIIASAMLLGLVFWVRESHPAPHHVPTTWALLLVALAALVLVPPLLTIRLEHRWLLTPSALMLISLMCALSRLAQWQRPAAVALGAICFGALALADEIVSRSFGEDMYLLRSSRMATAFLAAMSEIPAEGPIDIVAGDCPWTLHEDGMFRIYGNGPRPIRCYADQQAWLSDPARDSRLLVYDYAQHRFNPVPRAKSNGAAPE